MKWNEFNELPLWQQEMIYSNFMDKMPEGIAFDPELVMELCVEQTMEKFEELDR